MHAAAVCRSARPTVSGQPLVARPKDGEFHKRRLGLSAATTTSTSSPGTRARRRCTAASSSGADSPAPEDDDTPSPMGDWRDFRAKLVSESSESQQTSREASDNSQRLRLQNPSLAAEGLWCHQAAVEAGGVVLATKQGPELLQDDRYWQLVIFLLEHSPKRSVGVILNRPSAMTIGTLGLPVFDGNTVTTFATNAVYLGGLNKVETGTESPPRLLPHKNSHPWRWRGSKPKRRTRFECVSDDVVRPVQEEHCYVAPGPWAQSRLHCGGFTDQQFCTMIHGRKELEGASEVVPGIYMGGVAAATEAVNGGRAEPHEFRFFAGFQVWGPGQLEQEIAAGAWVPAACSRSLVLKQCLQLPTPLWKEVMELMGGEYGVSARSAYGQPS